MSPPRAALSVDVEFFSHTPAYRSATGAAARDAIGADGVTFLLDAFAQADARGTFFTVSEIAESHPDLVRAIAVRHELETEVTWDVPTITEDTTYIWRAAKYVDQQGGKFEYRLLNRRFRNQAPPTIRGMFNQRRRWMSGTLQDMYRLPKRYLPLQFTRIITWTLSPVIPLLSVLAFLYPQFVPQHGLYQITSIALFSMLFVYMIAGLIEYKKYPEVWPIYLVLTPLVVALHAVGALWGLLRPATDFRITEKTPGRVTQDQPERASAETLADLNPDLDAEIMEPNEPIEEDETTAAGND